MVGELSFFPYLCAMNFRKILLSSLTAIFILFNSHAKEDVVPQVHRDIHRMLQQDMEESLTFQALVDSVSSVQDDIAEVFELFVTSEIYPEWNDNFNPLSGNMTIPNTAEIDLTGFVAPIVGQTTSPYGWRRRRMHKGQDIHLNVGDTIRAAFDGRVRIKKFERRGYGYYYVIRHNNGLETIYGHLSRQLVDQDAVVHAGQAIGLGGSTGRSTGPHLHFEMRYMGIALDPTELIDFNTFQPKQTVYHFDKGRSEWAQSNKGKRGASYNAKKVTPAQKSGSTVSSASKSNNTGGSIHRVKKGDTLSGIAQRYGTTVSRLCKLNGIKANKTLQLGQKIRYK